MDFFKLIIIIIIIIIIMAVIVITRIAIKSAVVNDEEWSAVRCIENNLLHKSFR